MFIMIRFKARYTVVLLVNETITPILISHPPENQSIIVFFDIAIMILISTKIAILIQLMTSFRQFFYQISSNS